LILERSFGNSIRFLLITFPSIHPFIYLTLRAKSDPSHSTIANDIQISFAYKAKATRAAAPATRAPTLLVGAAFPEVATAAALLADEAAEEVPEAAELEAEDPADAAELAMEEEAPTAAELAVELALDALLEAMELAFEEEEAGAEDEADEEPAEEEPEEAWRIQISLVSD